MIFETLVTIAGMAEAKEKRRIARNERKRTQRTRVVRDGTEQQERRDAYAARKQNARDLRRVIRKTNTGQGIPLRLVPQIDRMRALTQADPKVQTLALAGVAHHAGVRHGR